MNGVLVATLCAVALTGCEREPSAAMRTFTVLADDVYACKDTQCVEDVVARVADSKPTPEQLTTRSDEAKAVAALQARINGCLKATNHGSGARPHSSMQVLLPSPK
jgi:hypothetical protein